MNPHQKNKVDVKSLTPEEQRLFRLYGKLPSRSDHFTKVLKERKYFDSGDYAMSKAGKGDSVDAGAVGSQHPSPENIPHLSSPISGNTNGPQHAHRASIPGIPGIQAGSPIKESSFLKSQTSAEESEAAQEEAANQDENDKPIDAQAAPVAVAGGPIPIRR
ncbi:camp-regulated phosphoprotein/endosulfine conserved region-domain-containing protein [Thelonectria olida]|uniref:mRNA stability protein n=1 Tax=Thelonectria olida TaxID=1576542 RepID=A0A9P8WL20_9HYPO|nr:camp-regulated phosphoprotein/endosulfine conserved region-domain-containing protein [Thelonectria olida]